MVKNDFLQKSKKKCHFPPLRGPTFQVSGLQHKKCGLWRWDRETDTGRIQTFLACPRYRIRSTYMGRLRREATTRLRLVPSDLTTKSLRDFFFFFFNYQLVQNLKILKNRTRHFCVCMKYHKSCSVTNYVAL